MKIAKCKHEEYQHIWNWDQDTEPVCLCRISA